MHVVIVEDDARICSFLSKGLKAEGYTATVFSNGLEAMREVPLLGNDVDVVLLDLGMPGADGQDILRSWRTREFDRPVIVLTARDDVAEKVRALDAGANDYVTKPFHFSELLARIRACLRNKDQAQSTTLSCEDLSLDLVTKVAFRAGRKIELAPREWALLELFLRNPRQILSRTQILAHVWEYSFDPGSNVVDVYVGYLRRKLNKPGLKPLLQTVRGAGYRLIS